MSFWWFGLSQRSVSIANNLREERNSWNHSLITWTATSWLLIKLEQYLASMVLGLSSNSLISTTKWSRREKPTLWMKDLLVIPQLLLDQWFQVMGISSKAIEDIASLLSMLQYRVWILISQFPPHLIYNQVKNGVKRSLSSIIWLRAGFTTELGSLPHWS